MDSMFLPPIDIEISELKLKPRIVMPYKSQISTHFAVAATVTMKKVGMYDILL